jgi:hypothetical protein
MPASKSQFLVLTSTHPLTVLPSPSFLEGATGQFMTVLKDGFSSEQDAIEYAQKESNESKKNFYLVQLQEGSPFIGTFSTIEKNKVTAYPVGNTHPKLLLKEGRGLEILFPQFKDLTDEEKQIIAPSKLKKTTLGSLVKQRIEGVSQQLKDSAGVSPIRTNSQSPSSASSPRETSTSSNQPRPSSSEDSLDVIDLVDKLFTAAAQSKKIDTTSDLTNQGALSTSSGNALSTANSSSISSVDSSPSGSGATTPFENLPMSNPSEASTSSSQSGSTVVAMDGEVEGFFLMTPEQQGDEIISSLQEVVENRKNKKPTPSDSKIDEIRLVEVSLAQPKEEPKLLVEHPIITRIKQEIKRLESTKDKALFLKPDAKIDVLNQLLEKLRNKAPEKFAEIILEWQVKEKMVSREKEIVIGKNGESENTKYSVKVHPGIIKIGKDKDHIKDVRGGSRNDVIDHHRNLFSFFGKTKTRQMVDEIEKAAQKIAKP